MLHTLSVHIARENGEGEYIISIIGHLVRLGLTSGKGHLWERLSLSCLTSGEVGLIMCHLHHNTLRVWVRNITCTI